MSALIETHNEAVNAFGHTQAQLETAFDLVANKDHWKGEIDAVVPMEEGVICMEAIERFTASQAQLAKFENGDYIKLVNGIKHVRLVAAGYWNGPANYIYSSPFSA